MPRRPPRRPAAWHGEGRPSLCFQRSPHSCHVHRSVGKSSPHEVIHMEHHIRGILILTRSRASSGCGQGLCLTYGQPEWGFHLRGQRGSRGPGGQHTPGGLLWGSRRPSLGILGWGLGSALCPWLLLRRHSCGTAACSVLSQSGGQPENRNYRRYFNRGDLIRGVGETGIGGL